MLHPLTPTTGALHQMPYRGIRYLALVPLSLLALYAFSTAQLMMFAMGLGLALALAHRIGALETQRTQGTVTLHSLRERDGGAFPGKPQPRRTGAGAKIVLDGGSFERSELERERSNQV